MPSPEDLSCDFCFVLYSSPQGPLEAAAPLLLGCERGGWGRRRGPLFESRPPRPPLVRLVGLPPSGPPRALAEDLQERPELQVPPRAPRHQRQTGANFDFHTTFQEMLKVFFSLFF